jgi:iron complex outermembrane receptor protein
MKNRTHTLLFRRASAVLLATLFAALPGQAASAAAPDAADVSALKRLSIGELLNVEVTSAARRPEPLADASAAIRVITADDIRRSGALYLPDVLRWADNLQVAQKSAHEWGISARGFNTDLANKLLVLVDGRSVYTPLFSGVFWDQQDLVLPDVDRIEVISGPGGTLWGANAVNGVINVISRHSRDTLGGLLQGGIGADERFAAARYGARLSPSMAFRVFGKYTRHDANGLVNGGDASDAWRMRRAGFRLDADRAGSLMVEGEYYDGSAAGAAAGSGRLTGENLEARWSQALAGGTHADLQLYGDRTFLAQPPSADGPGLTDDERTFDLDFQHRSTDRAPQRWVWGVGSRFTRDRVGNTAALSFFPAATTLKLFSAFAQDEFDLGPRAALTFGSKIEHNDYTGIEVEPSVRFRYAVAPAQTAWAAVSRAVRSPSRVDRDLRQPAPPRTILAGSSGFRSETVIAYEAGYRAQLGARTSVSVSTFYNDYDNLRSLGFTPVTIVPLVFENNLEGHTYGAELNAAVSVRENWQLRAAYSVLREHLRVKPGRIDLNHALNETADPAHQASLRSLLDLPGGWEVDASYRWVAALTMNNGGSPARVPAYDELDVRVGWRISRAFELSVDGRNLLHPSHVEYGAAVAIPRSLFASVTWRF